MRETQSRQLFKNVQSKLFPQIYAPLKRLETPKKPEAEFTHQRFQVA